MKSWILDTLIKHDKNIVDFESEMPSEKQYFYNVSRAIANPICSRENLYTHNWIYKFSKYIEHTRSRVYVCAVCGYYLAVCGYYLGYYYYRSKEYKKINYALVHITDDIEEYPFITFDLKKCSIIVMEKALD